MNKTINNESEIFDLIKKQEFDEIYKIIKNNKITNLDIKDSNYNYFIQYIVNYNQKLILELILSYHYKINIRIDILDIDGRTILYNCIKFNHLKMMELLIEYNKTTIGLSILNIPDKTGLTALHYSVIFNNFEAFKILLENEADPYALSKVGTNVFIACLMYRRNHMIDYLLEKKYKINFLNSTGETLLQVAINYNDTKAIERLLDTGINLNNISSDYGLTALSQTIALDNFDLYKKLLDKNVSINIPDFFGNLPLHYIFIYKKYEYLENLFKKPDIKYNSTNINGETPLHILLNNMSDINNMILEKILIETDLNIQNNQGVTCFMMIINNNLLAKFKHILVIKSLNFFIEDNTYVQPILTPQILEILVESYYNIIKVNKN